MAAEPFSMIAVLLALAVATSGALLSYLYDNTSPFAVRAALGICSGFALFATIAFGLSCWIGLNAGSIVLSLAFLLAPVVVTRNVWRAGLQRDLGVLKNAEDGDSPRAKGAAHLGLGLLMALLAWVYTRVCYEKPDGLYTAFATNLGDLPLHLQIISSFAWGQNFPPQNPIWSGSLFAYPFLPDFLTAVWVRCGLDFSPAMLLQNLMLIFAIVVLLHRFALELVRNRLAALLTPFLLIFFGGLGWMLYISDASDSPSGFWPLLKQLPHEYTNTAPAWRWSNALTTLFVTQRSLLMGFPLALAIFLLWWRHGTTQHDNSVHDNRVTEGAPPNETSPSSTLPHADSALEDSALAGLSHADSALVVSRAAMLAAGIFAGTLPLIHSHTFLVVALTAFYLAMLFRAQLFPNRHWLLFFAAMIVVALPQLVFLAIARRSEAGTDPKAFLDWTFGWDKGDANIFLFWFKNSGALWPLLFFVFWRNSHSRAALKRFGLYLLPLVLLFFIPRETGMFEATWLRVLVGLYLAVSPFVVARCWPRTEAQNDRNWKRAALFLSAFVAVGFIMPNLLRFAPWLWDNNKILIYWFAVALPFVALGLAFLWRARSWKRALAVALFFSMTWAGTLDIWRGVSGQLEQREFDRDEMIFAFAVRALPPDVLPPRAVVLHAPTYNSPLCLTGRISTMGYAGHLTSHGLKQETVDARAGEVADFLSGTFGSDRVLERYGVAAFIIGPQERDYLASLNPPRTLAPPAYWNKWKKVAQQGEYSLFTTR